MDFDDAKRWARYVGLLAVVAILLRVAWGWFSSDVSYMTVGPDPDEGRRVVVLLHGYGAPGDDLEGLAEEISEVLPDVSILIPQGPHRVGISGRSWLPDFQSPSRAEYIKRLATELEGVSAAVWAVIDDARGDGALCKDIYVGGFSQGGRVAAEVALRAPDGCDLGGVIVLSGGGVDDAELPAPTGRPPMRVLVAHGSADQVVKLGRGQWTATHFTKLGHQVRWLQFSGPHTIPLAVRDAIPAFLRGDEVGEAFRAKTGFP